LLSKHVNGLTLLKCLFKPYLILKNIIVAFSLAFLTVAVISCHKNNVQTNPLLGEWNLINDTSVILSFNGTNYIGTPADYYNFTANGTLYIKEDTLLSGPTYTMLINNQVDIVYHLANDAEDHRTYNITNLTAHTATLTLAGASLGPAEHQVINLKK
jgi:hypothetical protein